MFVDIEKLALQQDKELQQDKALQQHKAL